MFAKPRQKKTLGPPPKKRKAQHSIEEISFDNDARADYLTGFQKRKQARIKHAQEQAAEQARKDRIEMRKQLREERKRDIEKHVEQVNALLREAQHAGQEDDDSENGWEGFDDEPPPELKPMDFEEEYIDEDRFTTVKIESVNVDRDGLHRPEDEETSGDDEANGESKPEEKTVGDKKPSKDQKPKKKKKKFRYETKFERRLTESKRRAKKFAGAG
ncbi:rRNA processing protein Rrp17 [Pyricularia oryzae 70-15]|uniref:rRNA processing protein Rrp17 n=4 Tax=Pyricularia oryzae TaxID=318829 RepID=G4MY90_PYRO7|nr:rRNA processing protein Rrp17 [Pyricularia oryzae 70-15]ADD84643.1 conserved hypothetical protein [Pyricularia oryzae]ELQ39579.1 rRNA processing protein Rrp17 [Pyricularia oryzae Y34]EHA55225.1 rRNA processing protein Rrp17 [Pyricularia oryzae 70-15]KAI7913943.1 rRNA processing protein Rrp17 [Pyricularia oryzae]KAI7914835.1 rRNA processing protein Rrp17 [Pyricularia oryzae]